MSLSVSLLEVGLLVANIVAPGVLMVLLWRRARKMDPAFRIQFSVGELWVIGLCASPIGLVAYRVSQSHSIPIAAAMTLMLLEFHALAWFFLHAVDRLTHTLEQWRRPLVMLAGVAGAWIVVPFLCTGLSFVVLIVVGVILMLWPFFLLMSLVVYGMRYMRRLR